jgi:hypothetical protein
MTSVACEAFEMKNEMFRSHHQLAGWNLLEASRTASSWSEQSAINNVRNELKHACEKMQSGVVTGARTLCGNATVSGPVTIGRLHSCDDSLPLFNFVVFFVFF